LRLVILTVSVLACLFCAPASGASTTGTPAAKPPDFWRGRWSVVRDLGAPGITAMTDAQARQNLETVVELDDGSARFGREPCEAPTYAVSEQSLGDFLLSFRVTPDVFRLAGDRVRTLEVHCRRSITHIFAVLENGCVISARDGRFFQLTRLHPEAAATTSAPSCLR
jgi:hypothetical protein